MEMEIFGAYETFLVFLGEAGAPKGDLNRMNRLQISNFLLRPISIRIDSNEREMDRD
jgi:hypothetical protein